MLPIILKAGNSWREAESTGELLPGQPARKGFISSSSDVAKQLRQQRKQLRGGGGVGSRVYKNIVSAKSKELSGIYAIECFADTTPCYLPELRIDLGRFAEEESSNQSKCSY